MKKDPFFKRIVKAIKDPHFIANAPKEKTNSVVGYMILLLLILTIPTSIVKGVIIHNEMNNLLEEVDNPSFPTFELIDGKFTIDSEEPIIIEQNKQLMLIIDVNGESNINNLAGYDTGYLLTNDRLTITAKGQSPAYYNLDTLKGVEFNKTMFVSQLTFLTKISIFMVPIGVMIFSMIATFFRSIMLLLLAFILKRMLQIEEIRGSDLYKIVIYSMTLGVVLYQTITLLPLFLPIPFSADIMATFAPIVLFYIPSSTIMSRALRLIRASQDIKKLNS